MEKKSQNQDFYSRKQYEGNILPTAIDTIVGLTTCKILVSAVKKAEWAVDTWRAMGFALTTNKLN